jgi:hypothetical protein
MLLCAKRTMARGSRQSRLVLDQSLRAVSPTCARTATALVQRFPMR